jgi:hypothetical protein
MGCIAGKACKKCGYSFEFMLGKGWVYNQIEDLSPGDFKTVRDKFNFHPKKDLNHQILLQALSEESLIKNSHKMKRAIGF